MMLIILLLLPLVCSIHLRKQQDPLEDLPCLPNNTSSNTTTPGHSSESDPKFQGLALKGNETLFDKSTCNKKCLAQKKVKCECELNINELF